MKAYISGPIAGKPNKNKAAFAAEAEWLLSKGVEWVNPHHVPPKAHEGACPESYFHDKVHSSACYLRADLIAMLDCDVVLMIEGWVTSKGANLEIQVAKMAGIPVCYSRAEFFDRFVKPATKAVAR